MSRKSVRHAASDYLAAANIAGIGRVYPSPPKIARSADAFLGAVAGSPSGSVLFVEILQSMEIRLALGGPTSGSKAIEHTLRFHLLFRSRQGRAEDAMDDHDDQVEAILVRLRADRTLGTAGTIQQYGQDATGINIASGMPKVSGSGTVLVWTVIDGNAREFITA